VTKEIAQW